MMPSSQTSGLNLKKFFKFICASTCTYPPLQDSWCLAQVRSRSPSSPALREVAAFQMESPFKLRADLHRTLPRLHHALYPSVASPRAGAPASRTYLRKKATVRLSLSLSLSLSLLLIKILEPDPVTYDVCSTPRTRLPPRVAAAPIRVAPTHLSHEYSAH